MTCRYENRVWENLWCPVACRYCTLTEKNLYCTSKKPIEQTNAERFRSMTDEDILAFAKKQIGGGSDWFPCGAVCDGKCESYDDETCRTKILNWLNQPAKEESQS